MDWEKYYQEKEAWKSSPDEVMIQELKGIPPGRVVDLGAGEGTDAIWLAQNAWKVTAVDFSKTALNKAR